METNHILIVIDYCSGRNLHAMNSDPTGVLIGTSQRNFIP